jgi:hypothetical protein
MFKFLSLGFLSVFLLTACDPFTLFEPQANTRPYGNQRPYGQNPRPEPQPRPDGYQDDNFTPRPPDPEPVRGEYPLARRTDNPNQVISPFDPFNVIDVTGFSSGQLARDPSNQKIFRIP